MQSLCSAVASWLARSLACSLTVSLAPLFSFALSFSLDPSHCVSAVVVAVIDAGSHVERRCSHLGPDPESYITECTLVYKDKKPQLHRHATLFFLAQWKAALLHTHVFVVRGLNMRESYDFCLMGSFHATQPPRFSHRPSTMWQSLSEFMSRFCCMKTRCNPPVTWGVVYYY